MNSATKSAAAAGQNRIKDFFIRVETSRKYKEDVVRTFMGN